MSAHESYSTLVNSRAPRLTLGAQRNFKTWSSIDQELASHRASPLAIGPRALHGAARKKDRALFSARLALKPAQLREALLNVLFVGGAVSAIVIMATIVLLVPYWLLFVGE